MITITTTLIMPTTSGLHIPIPTPLPTQYITQQRRRRPTGGGRERGKVRRPRRDSSSGS